MNTDIILIVAWIHHI